MLLLFTLCLLPIQQGVNKGHMAKRLLLTVKQKSILLDFVLCNGDDRFDEDMFGVIMGAKESLSPVAKVFSCTVGQKPSKAKYFLDNTSEILLMLQGLAHSFDQVARFASQPAQRMFIA